MTEEKLNGLLLIDKEAGISSYDVIRKLKRNLYSTYGKQKIGHAGTLDPFATGVLIIMFGKATKLWSLIQSMEKGYRVKAEFGYETTTQDPEGEVVEKVDVSKTIDEKEIREALKKFTGDISQMPPIYSAKKVDGQRAYKLARAGKEVKLKPKDVTVHSFDLVSSDWPSVVFDLSVSSGTYVRTLVVDLAKELDSRATAVELARTYIGKHTLEESVSSSLIDDNFDVKKYLIPISIT